MEQMREDFEEWIKYEFWHSTERDGDGYIEFGLSEKWQTWQAAHAKYAKKDGQLVNGRIPAGQECPFTSMCSLKAANQCDHKGISHTVDFSCGAARAYDIDRRREAKNE